MGQLGVGDTTERYTPTWCMDDVKDVATGDKHTIVLRKDGTLWGMGSNTSGELGLGDTSSGHIFPTLIPNMDGITAIGAGFYHSMALKTDGTLRIWGDNFLKELGTSDDLDRYVPIPLLVESGTKEAESISTIAAGFEHTIALKSDGTLLSWWSNNERQLGLGYQEPDYNIAQPIPSVNDIMEIATGYEHSIALKSDGTLLSWGRSNLGQLGLGQYNPASEPKPIPDISSITAIAVGDHHNLALKSDGTLLSWGFNYDGQLGLGDNSNRHIPTPIPGISGIIAIAAGDNHSLAVTNDNRLLVWGNNGYGQLCLGDYNNRNTPTYVTFVAEDSNYINVSGGSNHSIFFENNGDVNLCGRNDWYQLGVGDNLTTSTLIANTSLFGMTSISAKNHNMAITSSGTLMAWGTNGYGQLGLGDLTIRSFATDIPDINGITKVTTGDGHTIALKSDGSLLSWGNNNKGQLGTGDNTNRTSKASVLEAIYLPVYIGINNHVATNSPTSLVPVINYLLY